MRQWFCFARLRPDYTVTKSRGNGSTIFLRTYVKLNLGISYCTNPRHFEGCSSPAYFQSKSKGAEWCFEWWLFSFPCVDWVGIAVGRNELRKRRNALGYKDIKSMLACKPWIIIQIHSFLYYQSLAPAVASPRWGEYEGKPLSVLRRTDFELYWSN